MVRTRLLSFGLVIGLGFLLLVSLIVSAGITAFGHFLGESFPGEETLLRIFDFVFSFAAITVVIAVLYKLLPAAAIRWSDVWSGAAMTSALFSFGKFLIGLYIGKAAFSSSFGAAGGASTWISAGVGTYYAAQIFLFGAEFTYFRCKARWKTSKFHLTPLQLRHRGGAAGPCDSPQTAEQNVHSVVFITDSNVETPMGPQRTGRSLYSDLDRQQAASVREMCRPAGSGLASGKACSPRCWASRPRCR